MKAVRRAGRLVATTVLGAVLLAAGLVMLVTPGPGLVAIAAGLAVLAREFAWARRLLDRVRRRLVSRRFRRADQHPTVVALPDHAPPEPVPHGRRHVA